MLDQSGPERAPMAIKVGSEFQTKKILWKSRKRTTSSVSSTKDKSTRKRALTRLSSTNANTEQLSQMRARHGPTDARKSTSTSSACVLTEKLAWQTLQVLGW